MISLKLNKFTSPEMANKLTNLLLVSFEVKEI